MRLFKKPFMATGKGDDISYVDFNHLGLYKEQTIDNKGDIIEKLFYKNYDSQTKVFSDLAIKEVRTYNRDASNGLPVLRLTDATYYATDGTILLERLGLPKIYTPEQGYAANKRARQNLLDRASLYFYMQLVNNASGDTTIADTNKNNFDQHSSDAQAKYIRSNISPLVTMITESTDSQSPNYKAYITPTMAATMVAILNIDYDGA